MKTFRLLAAITTALLLITACGSSGSDVAGLDTAETLWLESAIDSYTMEYTMTGGDLLGPFEIEVVDGEVVNFENFGELGGEGQIRTVLDLFEETRDIADEGDVLAAEFDADLGYPTLLDFDPIPEGVDDEYTIEVISLTETD